MNDRCFKRNFLDVIKNIRLKCQNNTFNHGSLSIIRYIFYKIFQICRIFSIPFILHRSGRNGLAKRSEEKSTVMRQLFGSDTVLLLRTIDDTFAMQSSDHDLVMMIRLCLNDQESDQHPLMIR